MQCNALGLNGGAYICEVTQGGAAQQGGLAVGDIVIRYGDRDIAAMPDMVAALQDTNQKTHIPVTYLRLDAQARFTRRSVVLAGGPPGAGFLPV